MVPPEINVLNFAWCMCVLQAVKFEPYHDSALVRFLLKRALRVNRTNICVCFSHCLVTFVEYSEWESVCVCVCVCVCQSKQGTCFGMLLMPNNHTVIAVVSSMFCFLSTE